MRNLNTAVREIEVELIREQAFSSVTEELKAGRIAPEEAVNALRHAYRRAHCHAQQGSAPATGMRA